MYTCAFPSYRVSSDVLEKYGYRAGRATLGFQPLLPPLPGETFLLKLNWAAYRLDRFPQLTHGP